MSISLGKAYTSFADVNLCMQVSILSHQIAILIYLNLGDTRQENCLFFLKLSFDFENEKLSTHAIEVEMSCSSFAKRFYGDIASTIKMMPDLLRTLMSSC